MQMCLHAVTNARTHTFCVLLIIQLIFQKANVCIIFGKNNESFQKTLGSPSLPSSLSFSICVRYAWVYECFRVALHTFYIAQRINSWHLILSSMLPVENEIALKLREHAHCTTAQRGRERTLAIEMDNQKLVFRNLLW